MPDTHGQALTINSSIGPGSLPVLVAVPAGTLMPSVG